MACALGCSQVVRHRSLKPRCAGPIPATPAKLKLTRLRPRFFVVCHRFKEGYNPFERRNNDSSDLKIKPNRSSTNENIFPKKAKFLNNTLDKNDNYKYSHKKLNLYKKSPNKLINKIEYKNSDNSNSIKKLSKKQKKKINKKKKNPSFSLPDKKEGSNCIEYNTLIRFHSNNAHIKTSLEKNENINKYSRD